MGGSGKQRQRAVSSILSVFILPRIEFFKEDERGQRLQVSATRVTVSYWEATV